MKKIFIFICIIILGLSIVFLNCEDHLAPPSLPKNIKIKFNIQPYVSPVVYLDSINNSPFDIVNQTILYDSGYFELINKKEEIIRVSFERDGLDTTQIILVEGDWKIKDNFITLKNYEFNENYFIYATPIINEYKLASSINYSYPDKEFKEYQTIDEKTITLNLFIVPSLDCIAIYDTLNLLKSIVSYTNPLLKNEMQNYSNGVNVFYSANQWYIHYIELNSNEVEILDMQEIRNSLFGNNNHNIYFGSKNDHHFFMKPLFICVKLFY